MKITVFKTVYWNEGSSVKTGKVKQILRDHAVVDVNGTTHIVSTAILSLKPIKVASGEAEKKIIKSAKLGS
jgi:hypothetical protein